MGTVSLMVLVTLAVCVRLNLNQRSRSLFTVSQESLKWLPATMSQ
jgi:hypothetical protein